MKKKRNQKKKVVYSIQLKNLYSIQIFFFYTNHILQNKYFTAAFLFLYTNIFKISSMDKYSFIFNIFLYFFITFYLYIIIIFLKDL